MSNVEMSAIVEFNNSARLLDEDISPTFSSRLQNTHPKGPRKMTQKQK